MMIYTLHNFPLAATKLIEGKDVSAIEEKIHKYENENAELIKLRRDQKVQ
jgi:hypothetical protein